MAIRTPLETGMDVEAQGPGICPAWAPDQLDNAAAEALQKAFFFLALFFRYPEERIYAEIKRHSPAMEAFFADYGKEPPDIPPLRELQPEYVRLFVNNQGFVPAVPYASCHLDGGQLKGDSYYRLRQMMAASGFTINDAVRELEDHLSILLEFASSLILRLLERKADGNPNAAIEVEALVTVTADYLQPLIEAITDKITEHAQLDFYRTGAQALRAFVHDTENIYEQVLGICRNA